MKYHNYRICQYHRVCVYECLCVCITTEIIFPIQPREMVAWETEEVALENKLLNKLQKPDTYL